MQVKHIFQIEEFLEHVQQDFSKYDYFTNQENLKYKFKKYVPGRKE